MQQLNLSGQTKEEIAIDFFRKYEPEEGYAGFYSGGKDSGVLKDIGDKSGCKIQWFYSLMPDPPELIQFVKSRPFPITILRPDISFWRGVVRNFPPHRKGAWCCTEIKEKPSAKLLYTHRLLGIRAEEGKGVFLFFH